MVEETKWIKESGEKGLTDTAKAMLSESEVEV